MPDGTDWSAALAREIIRTNSDQDGAALPVLHALNSVFGYVPDGAVPLVAEALNLSRAEVHGIVTFYHDFRRAPTGRHVLRLCRAEACQSMGADALAARLQALLGAGWSETSADGKVTLEAVFCLGLCACAPAAMLDGAPIGRLNAARVDALVAALR